MPYILKAALSAVTFFVVLFSLLYAFVTFGPMYETKFLPVVTGVQATPIEIDRNQQVVRVAVLGDKVRQCERVGSVAMILNGGVWSTARVYMNDPRNSELQEKIGTNRPLGQQSFGEIYISPLGEAIRVYVYHRCHPLWQTQTALYELDLTKDVGQ